MNKLIVVFSMFSYQEYKLGITNTNSHIYNWLKDKNKDTKIIFVDFNRYGFINKLKYLIKYVLFSKTNNKIFSNWFNVLDEVENNILNYRGVSYNKLFNFLNNQNLRIEVWSFNPFIERYQLNNSNKYFYTIDDWRKNKVFKKFKKYLEQQYNKIPSIFDIVFVNNNNLKKKLFNLAKNIHFIPNGVDTKFITDYKNTSSQIKMQIDQKFDKKDKKVVGYYGVISSDRVDMALCEYIIKTNPKLLFVFAGPVLTGFDSQSLVSKYNNVRFIGTVYYPQLPYLLSKFDVCIIPHKLSEFIQSMDPKKLYEYLAAGKPVVSTPVSGSNNFESIINITSNHKIFSDHIVNALNNDSEDKVNTRKKIASQHDWQKRFEQISKII